MISKYLHGVVLAHRYIRKDGKRFSDTEMILIGSTINKAAERVMPTSPHDKLYTVLFYIKAVRGQNNDAEMSEEERILRHSPRPAMICYVIVKTERLEVKSRKQNRKYVLAS